MQAMSRPRAGAVGHPASVCTLAGLAAPGTLPDEVARADPRGYA